MIRPIEMVRKWHWPDCMQELEPGYNYCPKCGEKIDWSENANMTVHELITELEKIPNKNLPVRAWKTATYAAAHPTIDIQTVICDKESKEVILAYDGRL